MSKLMLSGAQGLVGAPDGGGIDALVQRRERGCAATMLRYAHAPQGALRVRVERVWVGPVETSPGQTVDIVVCSALIPGRGSE